MKRKTHSTVDLLLRGILETSPGFSVNPLGDWNELAGEMVGQHSQPVSLKKKVLKVVAYDSVWKHHLELNKDLLMQNINRDHPEPIVEKIVVFVGEVPGALPPLNPNSKLLEKIESKKARPRKRKKPKLRPLTDEEKKLLQSLPDPELRAVSERLLRLIPLEPDAE